MQYNIQGSNLEITSKMREHIEKALDKAELRVPSANHSVTCSMDNGKNKKIRIQLNYTPDNGTMVTVTKTVDEFYSGVICVFDAMYKLTDSKKNNHRQKVKRRNRPEAA